MSHSPAVARETSGTERGCSLQGEPRSMPEPAAAAATDAATTEAAAREPHNRFGIQPTGNAFFDQRPLITPGLQHSPFAKLAHTLLLSLLEYCGPQSLCRLGSCCKMLYAFTNHPPLWKDLVIGRFKGEFDCLQSWKTTYMVSDHRRSKRGIHVANGPGGHSHAYRPSAPLSFKGLYSDVLHKYWFHTDAHYPQEWLEVDNVDRRSNLTVEEFNRVYASGIKRPVILTDVVPKWKAFGLWSNEYLSANHGNVRFKANGIRISFKRYRQYCQEIREEVPLYLFDKHFCHTCPELAKHFEVPPYFSEDLFQVFGADKRPDHRWLIAGPAKSGSFFHKDPNHTSAWNAVITGAKKWILYPPHILPPGVGQSPDGAEVSVPLSLHEWFTNFYADTKNDRVPPIECICRAGEIIYVPSGWWHMVLNLEDSIAITQNFVSTQNLLGVRRFLREKVPQISGFHVLTRGRTHANCAKDAVDDGDIPKEEYREAVCVSEIADLFDTLLEEKLPGTLQKALAEEEKAGGRAKRKAVALENSESGPNCRVRLGEEGHNEEKEKPKVFQFNFLFD